MESSDVLSYIGALGAIATVIALIPEKNRMAAFSFLKKILRQVLNFFRKAIKTAELETIQETAPEGAKAVGTFRIQRLKPICSITMTRDFPNEYTILEVTYEPKKKSFLLRRCAAASRFTRLLSGTTGESDVRTFFEAPLKKTWQSEKNLKPSSRTTSEVTEAFCWLLLLQMSPD